MDKRVTQPQNFDIGRWSGAHLQRIERALERWVGEHSATTAGQSGPAALAAAMRYAVLDGGKRLRPLLVLAAWETINAETPEEINPGGEAVVRAGHNEATLRAACAVELIHAYSLVHDDLPCMDNDVLRRGKPTVHVRFGEALALLAGDALQALAFELLTPETGAMSELQQARLCRLLARAAGSAGMAGGQAIDLQSVGLGLSEAQLRHMHSLKTGALLQSSVLMGAACGQASNEALQSLASYGQALGLAFQVVDDMLDVTADSATLGKTAGKDAAQAKPTFVSLLGLEQSGELARQLLEQALEALAQSGLRETRALAGLARTVVNRSC